MSNSNHVSLSSDVHLVLVPRRLHHPPLRRPLHLLRELRRAPRGAGQKHRARLDHQLCPKLNLRQRERQRGFEVRLGCHQTESSANTEMRNPMLQVAGHQVRAGDQRPDVREAQDQPEESGGRGGGRIRDVSLAGDHQGQEDEVGMDSLSFYQLSLKLILDLETRFLTKLTTLMKRQRTKTRRNTNVNVKCKVYGY